MTAFLRILLVEDEPEQRVLLAELLRDVGVEVWEAATGAQGYELFLLHEQKISVVISDFHLPDFTGADLYTRIREQRPDCPFICLTALPSDCAELAGLTGKTNVELLQKPCHFSFLLSVIQTLVTGKQF